MESVLFFKEMITPKIITLLYWLLLAGVVITGVGAMFAGSMMGGGFGFGSFLHGLMIIVFGAIGVRVWCELLIVLFKIHENIQRLADK